MRIAQVAPLSESIPPRLYGGTERIVSYLGDRLVEKGHEVTVFASGDSKVAGRLIPCRDKARRLDRDPLHCDIADDMVMLELVHDMADEFDIIHFHTDLLHMQVFGDMPEKTVTTLHGRLDLKGLKSFFRTFDLFPLVSISDAQREPVPTANFVWTIYHGVPRRTYKFRSEGEQDYVAFLGRFSPEKGAEKAIEIARQAGYPIRLAAKICNQSEANKVYYRNVVEPLLELDFVDYAGEIGEHEKSDFLGHAKALLMPINWPECFGLVMIEAMACGTPVIAFRYGSVPEVVEHGVTGFIVDSIEEAVEAMRYVDALDRATIRQRFEERFSVEAMVQNYVQLYRELLKVTDRSVAAPVKMFGGARGIAQTGKVLPVRTLPGSGDGRLMPG
ncbi:MAG: glycosyltransferase family 4 protein [Alphaproteobacteria bacterium]|nr:glycosyltransferase family 4 protein [Alphaproteobacteria bacterium]